MCQTSLFWDFVEFCWKQGNFWNVLNPSHAWTLPYDSSFSRLLFRAHARLQMFSPRLEWINTYTLQKPAVRHKRPFGMFSRNRVPMIICDRARTCRPKITIKTSAPLKIQDTFFFFFVQNGWIFPPGTAFMRGQWTSQHGETNPTRQQHEGSASEASAGAISSALLC